MSAARVKVMFIEVTNDNEAFLKNQYKETASTSPDYEGICDKDAVSIHIHTPIHTYIHKTYIFFDCHVYRKSITERKWRSSRLFSSLWIPERIKPWSRTGHTSSAIIPFNTSSFITSRGTYSKRYYGSIYLSLPKRKLLSCWNLSV